MRAKHAFGLMIMAVPLLSAAEAEAGWGWDSIVSTGPSVLSSMPPGDKTLEAASRAVHEGKDAEALVLIRTAPPSFSNGAPAHLELARLQFADKQTAKGRRSLEQAAAEAPSDPRVYLAFSSLALVEGRNSDARLNAEKSLSLLEGTKLDAETVREIRREAFAGLAAVAEAQEDWPSARADLFAWLEIEPGNAQARQRLGRALFRLGKTDEAYKELVRSAKDDPRLGPAAVPMGLLFAQAGNDAKAEEWFAFGAKVEPKSVVVRLTHARWRLDKGRAGEARPLVEEAANLDPKSKEIEPLRGLIAWQLRELGTAERIFEALHRDAPNDAGYASLLTLALVEQDDPAKRARGLQLAEANARQFPNALDVLASLGRARARSGHPEEAEKALRAAIAGAGGRATPTVAYFLAQVLTETGHADDARGLLSQATATPISFAYESDAWKLLTSLGQDGLSSPASPLTNRAPMPNP
jgi:tetratricopeptide (TPR) repeat protein